MACVFGNRKLIRLQLAALMRRMQHRRVQARSHRRFSKWNVLLQDKYNHLLCFGGASVPFSRWKYTHCPSGALSSSSSHLYHVSASLGNTVYTRQPHRQGRETYTLDSAITSTSLSSPSATCITSSINPLPSWFSRSAILESPTCQSYSFRS